MDKVLDSFLLQQLEEGRALANESDILELAPLPFDGYPPRRYIAKFLCRGLIKTDEGEVREANEFQVGIWFSSSYLRVVDPFKIVTWLSPKEAHHPNIRGAAGLMCIGKISPGTALVDILYQCYEVITYNKVTMREDDALDDDACRWARENLHRFPLDRRPLKRRELKLGAGVLSDGVK